MAEAAPIQTSFNGGEISPLMGGRTDLAAYAISVAEMLNIVPTIQGAGLKRSGSRFVAAAKTAAGDARLIPFEAQLTQAYVIEATDLAFRFYTNNGQIVSGGSPYEVAHSYAAAELDALQYSQSNDVMYLAHGSHKPASLSRTSATTFALADLVLKNGPFKDQNSNEAVTVTASGTTGSITITASSGIFAAGHVGALFRMEAKDFSDIAAWEPAITGVAVGDKRRSEGKVYQAAQLSAGVTKRTGTVQPTHNSGSEWDGMASGKDINDKDAGGVLWTYLYDRYGIVQITGYTSPTQVTATVLRRLPDSLVSVASWRWAHAAFSTVEGWPSAVAIWNERLVLGKGATLYGSVVGDFTNFAERDSTGAIAADMAFRFTLASPNPIRWIVADRQLIVGTTKGEFAIGPLNSSQAPGPTNLQAPSQSFYGSTSAKPVQIGSRTIFVQRAARKIREAGYDFNVDRYVATDVTVRSEHITRGGVGELAFQQEPFNLLWAVRGDGALLSFTYSEEQEVRGWARHILGGYSDAAQTVPAIVESIATIPDPAGERDQLWMLVRRYINGTSRRYVERLESFWDFGAALKDAFFVDCGLSYAGAPVTTINGLDHLAGQTVWILADGATHPDKTVSPGGSITLDRQASTVQIGLAYRARVTTLRLDAGSRDGTAQAKVKKIVKLALRLLETLGLRVGPKDGQQDEILHRSSADLMDQPPALFSGDQVMDYPGSFERDGQITVESFQPLPLTLLALLPRVTTRD